MNCFLDEWWTGLMQGFCGWKLEGVAINPYKVQKS